MEESVTLAQMLGGILAGSGVSIGTVIAGWVALKTKVGKMESDIDYLKKEDEKMSDLIKEIRTENQMAYRNLDAKMDGLFVGINELKIELQNKKNREN